ncbi:MAG: 4-hydroxy-tetrahydrodipicolinate reductase [Bacteroidota bacterium]
MNIALLGYGKMGKEIEKIALERGHTIVLKIDVDNVSDMTSENLQKADVAIDFSVPSSAYDNIMKCFESNLPIVSGTTGWIDRKQEVEKECREKNQTFFYASNYSLGVNLFFKLNQFLAKIMDPFDQYDVAIEETHHTQKLDAPSGTAITLAEDILDNIERKSTWELDSEDKSKLNIKAIRKENVPGIHTVTYDSEVDYITMTHSAKSRKGFALGAVLAAEFAKDNKGILTMDDLMQI